MIFWLGVKVANYKSFFFLSGGLLIIIGAILIILLIKNKTQKEEIAYNDWKNKLIKNGIKIEVDLDRCELLSNAYREEIITDGLSKSEQFDGLEAHFSGKDIREFENINQSQLVLKKEISGLKLNYYSPIFNKDKTTLHFFLFDQKTTNLYIDRFEPENYFF